MASFLLGYFCFLKTQTVMKTHVTPFLISSLNIWHLTLKSFLGSNLFSANSLNEFLDKSRARPQAGLFNFSLDDIIDYGLTL